MVGNLSGGLSVPIVKGSPPLKCFLEYIPQNVLRIKHVLRLNKFESIGFYRGEVDFSTTEPFRSFF